MSISQRFLIADGVVFFPKDKEPVETCQVRPMVIFRHPGARGAAPDRFVTGISIDNRARGVQRPMKSAGTIGYQLQGCCNVRRSLVP